MLTMIHSNPALVVGGRLTIDRKFHEGMLNYVQHLGPDITTVHPSPNAGFKVMDPVDIPLSDLGYRVLVANERDPHWPAQLSGCIGQSALVYGEGLGSEALARQQDVAQIAVLEYDLPTRIVVSASTVRSPIRKANRTWKTFLNYRQGVAHWRRMNALHCNGYPIYDATADVNRERLLYLDSRMTASMVIGEEELERRLGRAKSRIRLLYSGRYEPMKGAIDVIKVAIACRRRGIDMELACYGQGSDRDAMRKLVVEADLADSIVIHDAVPYPELVKLSREFDVFVCCHVQADPSCTYLESFGAGLPIVGYGNTMWRRLCEEAEAGCHSTVGRPDDVAADIGSLASNRSMLAEKSRQARSFANAHTFEIEFRKRTDDIHRWMRLRARAA